MATPSFHEFLQQAQTPPKKVKRKRGPSLEDIFEEQPVDLDTFIRDTKFLGERRVTLSPIQRDLVQHIERIYYPNLYPKMANEWGGYWRKTKGIHVRNKITAEWGKGSGKDAMVRFGLLRVAYLLMCMRSPQEYFHMAAQDSIHMLNVAANAPQANRAFFEPMTRAVSRSRWFRDRTSVTQNEIRFDKGITAISGHSEAEGLEGLNLILAVADEIDAFRSRDEMNLGNKTRELSTSAESMMKMLNSSAITRFPQTYKLVAISYPRYVGSVIQKLRWAGEKDIKESGDKAVSYVTGPFATWEVNPTKKRSDFDAEYREDPVEAAAKFECKPAKAVDTYFKNPSIFSNAVDRPEQPISVYYEIVDKISDETGVHTKGWEAKYIIDPDFKPIAGARYAIHGDLAIRGDRAGIAMSHVERWEERNVEVVDDAGAKHIASETVPIIRNDFCFGYEADLGARDEQGNPFPREIQVRWVRELAFDLIRRGFNIAYMSYDQFNSADSLQILSAHGIEAEKMSADRSTNKQYGDVWKNLKDVASEGRLKMPYSELLYDELENLVKVRGKVDHMPHKSKDLSDAFACSIVGAILAGGDEDPNGEVPQFSEDTFEAVDNFDMPIGLTDYGPGSTMPIGYGNTGLDPWAF